MTGKDEEQLPKDWHEEAIEKLRALHVKVSSYASKGYPGQSPQTGPSTSDDARSNFNEMSLEQIRDRLHSINDYFRERLAGRQVEPPPPLTLKPPAESIVITPEESVPPKVEPLPEKILPKIPAVFKPSAKTPRPLIGVGLDLGTSSIVASREQEDHRVASRLERNIFLGVRNDDVTKGLLAKLGIKYAATAGKLYVLGDMALELSHIFSREGQRPMRIGILNPTEMESLPIIKLLVQNVLWPPRVEGEVCCFSVPSKIVDSDSDVIYHRGIFERILSELGFKAAVMEEGYAVVLSELADKDFTGIGISCGAGLVNVCAAFKSMPVLSFSVARGGDWIDKNAAMALGIVSSNVIAIKEHGLDLLKPTNRESEAIAIYYRSYIHYFLEAIARMFSSGNSAPRFTGPVDIMFAGGACLAGNFLEVVKEELKMIDLGIPVGNIRKANEPLLSVSRGCLFHAMNSLQYGEAAAS